MYTISNEDNTLRQGCGDKAKTCQFDGGLYAVGFYFHNFQNDDDILRKKIRVATPKLLDFSAATFLYVRNFCENDGLRFSCETLGFTVASQSYLGVSTFLA